MKRNNYSFIIPILILGVVLLIACSKSFLDIPPAASLSPNTLANKTGAEAILVGAYSLLDGEGGAGGGNGPWATAASNWVYGSTPGGDAHKGSDAGDQNLITPIETWNTLPANNYLVDVWRARYDGVQRANEAIRIMRLAKDVTAADTIQITAEARFLRAHYAFELYKMFKNIPWIDENITYSKGNWHVPNTTDVLPNIEADLAYAYANLPETQSQVGRANKWAAASYLGKIYLWEKKYSDARTLLTTVVANGKTSGGLPYKLVAHYADNFNPATKNSSESILAAQNSVNDGSGAGNANAGDVLNFPYSPNSPGGCCGFFQPSYSFVNSFKTDPANGFIPFLDGSFNNADLKNDEGIPESTPYVADIVTPVDPRLDWSVGRRGIPYLDFGIMPGTSWIRDQASAGPYAPIKNVYYKSQKGVFTDNSSWTSGYTANNTNLIRFADVLLWAAEAEVEGGGTLAQALKYVNMVRARAMDPSGFVQGSVANYQIGLYTSFPSADYARKAIYFERKVELGMEGHRFFDLVRWGIAATELQAYQQHELASGYLIMKNVVFHPGKSEFLPIPQTEIDLSSQAGKSVLTQNPGY